MQETILIILFFTIVVIFYLINISEVTYCESFDNSSYLVRDLPDKKEAANYIAEIKKRLKNIINYIESKDNSDEKINFIKPYVKFR